MSPRVKKTPAPNKGELAWSVRGTGAPPAGILGGPGSEKVTDEHTAELVNSLAYRVLELVPTLSHEEILEAVDGVDPEDPLTLYILQKNEGMFGTLDQMDGATWIEGGGPQLVGKMHGGGRYQLRLQGHKSGLRKWIKQPMFQVPGRVTSPNAPATSTSGLELAKEIALIVGAVTPVLKMIMGDRAAPVATDPATLIKMFREGMELGKETVKLKNGGDDVSFGKTLRDLLPPALQTFREIAASSSSGAPAAPAQQLPPGGAAAPPAEPAGPPPPAWVVVMRPHVPELLKLAAFVADVQHWAAQVVGMVSEAGQLSFFEEQLARGAAWRAEFFQYFPETMPHRDWFERFFDAVQVELVDDDDDDDDDEEGEPTQTPVNRTRTTLPGFDA